jgi:hypothetical protein
MRGRGEEERGGGWLFYATRSPILSKMLAERISVQAINEKVPTIDHVGPWFVLQLFCLLSLRPPKPTTNNRGLESNQNGFSPFTSATHPSHHLFWASLGHSPVQARTSHTSHALGRDIRNLSPGEVKNILL